MRGPVNGHHYLKGPTKFEKWTRPNSEISNFSCGFWLPLKTPCYKVKFIIVSHQFYPTCSWTIQGLLGLNLGRSYWARPKPE
ncbi:hypothetical protein EUGRSUZ_K01088 [Eucalyptus grandis]|uniref:Uncharacterized protein n=2 Tax=Eucalyptus grandis TaxID=71139 RepID=A0ACC3ISQ7_EUCGR|nr:hypothetical protein EUGRSUZ_K01088 [Eucalyptus grandis]